MPIDIYSPRYLSAVLESTPEVRTYLRDKFFSEVETFPTEGVEFDVKTGNRKLAPFKNPKLKGTISKNGGYHTIKLEPPMISATRVTDAANLMSRMAGESLYSGVTPEERGLKKLSEDTIKNDEEVTRREEWMCAQVLLTGKIPLKAEGLQEDIDLGFTNIIKTTVEGKWTDAKSDPLEQIEAAYLDIQKNGFTNCDTLIVSNDVKNALVRHKGLKEMMDNRRYEIGRVAPRQLDKGVSYVMTLTELGIDVYCYNEWFEDTDGEVKPLIPSGTAILIDSQANFKMLYAAITYKPEDSKIFVTEEGTRVIDSWSEKDPDRTILSLNASPLPAPLDINSWCVFTELV